ncbi:MAG: DUF2779 domain-containing protein [Gemmatimonadetes bacterium]|nr:DUF2779 domain-containing protein [Gemmatimonadota bacterium]
MSPVGRLAKETFLLADTCLTQGWYAARVAKRAPTPAAEWRFFVGAEVGQIARASMGNGPVLPTAPLARAQTATAQAIASATAVAYEPTFATKHFVARADAIRRNGDGWDLIEIKSGKLPADGDQKKVRADYIDDIAYTTFVARQSGLEVSRTLLVLVRDDYRRGRPVSELLGKIDVSARAFPRAAEFAANAPQMAAALAREQPPNPDLIPACRKCEFYEEFCIGTRIGTYDPIFLLPNLRGKRFENVRPYERITALPDDADLTDIQRRIAAAFRQGPLVEPGIAQLDEIEWPAYYLDFESVDPAIPWFEGDEPYEAIPFQFSLHLCEAPGRITSHRAYLAPVDGDWRRDLAITLIGSLGTAGSILMYTAYEVRMIRYLAKALPDLSASLNAFTTRLFDIEPIFHHGYYHPGFRGRTSIKETLPTLVAELDYKKLAVQNGGDASALFALTHAGQYPAADWEQHRADLLEYCALDTLAMVRLHAELVKIRATLS